MKAGMKPWIRTVALALVLAGGTPCLALGSTEAPDPAKAQPQDATLQILLRKGIITQAEYDDAVAGARAAAGTVIRETVVVEQTPRINAPPVTSRWGATLYGFVEADFVYDSTQSFGDIAGNAIIAADGYAAQNHRLQFSVRNTRLGFRFAAPDWEEVKSSAVLEMDFFGNQPGTPPAYGEGSWFGNPGFRIRLAYLKLETPVVDLVLGQNWALFGWQPYFSPNTVIIQGLPGQAFARTVQARISKTLRTDPVNLELAVAASRPPQRDAYVPDLQFGARVNVNDWKGVSTWGGTGTTFLSASLGVSGAWRRFQVQEPSADLGYPNGSAVTTGWGVSVNALIPVLPVRGNDRGNGLTFTGAFVTGAGISDLFTSLTGGLGSPSATPGIAPAVGYVASVDPGLVMFGSDGSLNAIAWQAFMVGLQYYLPPSGRVWVSVNYSDMYSSNIHAYADPATVYDRSQWADGNVFWDATDAVRFGVEYSWFRQNRVDGNQATDNRVQFSAYYLF